MDIADLPTDLTDRLALPPSTNACHNAPFDQFQPQAPGEEENSMILMLYCTSRIA